MKDRIRGIVNCLFAALDQNPMTYVRRLFKIHMSAGTWAGGTTDDSALSAAFTNVSTHVAGNYRIQAALFQAVMENMAQGICSFDKEHRLVVCNRRYAEIYGLRPEHVCTGATLADIVERRYQVGSTPAMTAAEYLHWRDQVAETSLPNDSVMELQNGRVIAIRHQPMPDGGWVATHEDITDRRDSERRLAYLARHDAVTGLPNRVSLAEHLAAALSRSSYCAPCAVLSISLDGVDAVKGTLGHLAGEKLLHIICERLGQHLGRGEMLAYTGTNEFLIVQSGAAETVAVTRLAQRLLKVIAEPVLINGEQPVIGASIGVAVSGAPELDAEDLIKNAGVALYRAKTEGRGQYRMFEPEMDALMQARRLLETDLREAISDMTFKLFYQPQVDPQTRQVRGFETLLRWFHPIRGAVSPSVFVPVAEEMGLIGPITEWVLERGCTEAACWPDGISVAINISALQLQDGSLPGMLAAALSRSGLQPSRLELEITEGCIVTDAVAATATLHELRKLGVRIALDDFGTGYSSLSYLPSLPIDKVKIDRSFVAKLGDGPAAGAIVRAIISLCQSLGLSCNAEGVETADQLAWLVGEKCTEVQGYLLGQPCPSRDIAAVLETARHSHAGSPAPRSTATLVVPVFPAVPADIFSQIVETANDIIIVTDAALDAPGPTILYVNPAFTKLTGYEATEVIGKTPRMLQGPGTSRATLNEIAAALKEGNEVRQKLLNYTKHGIPYWLDLRITPIRDRAGAIVQFVAIERDVTLDKRRLDELEYVADRDTLTGIPNRRALLRTLDAELQAARTRSANGPCLAYIDVDHFKRVNDELGHLTGDAVLSGIAERLTENVRRVDSVGRLGGEEFAVCMPSVTLREAAALGERLRGAVAARPFDTPTGPVHVTISVGVSEALLDEHSLSDLMMRADCAMYLAKHSGRNRVAVETSV